YVQAYLSAVAPNEPAISVQSLRANRYVRETLFRIAGEFSLRTYEGPDGSKVSLSHLLGIDEASVTDVFSPHAALDGGALRQAVVALRAKGYAGPLRLETLAHQLDVFGLGSPELEASILKVRWAASREGTVNNYALPFGAARTLEVILFGADEVAKYHYQLENVPVDAGVEARLSPARVRFSDPYTGEETEWTFDGRGVLRREAISGPRRTVVTTFDLNGFARQKMDGAGTVLENFGQ